VRTTSDARVPSADLFRATGAARARGKLWHVWLERLTWIEDGMPELDELVALAEGQGSDAALARLEARAFLEVLGRAEIRGEVSRAGAAARLGAASEELELLREQRFAFAETRAGGRRILQGAFDRAVVARGVQRAEIVDFKTDAFGPGVDLAELDLRARAYLPQMRAYREALAQSTGIPLERIAMRLCFLGAGRTVCLTDEEP
jgi:ATP-dependent exoDNAse (exonuclease V) beta subunit